jgi:hypothetical protein
MTIPMDRPTRPLRLWPGVMIAVLAALVWFVVPRVVPDGEGFGLLGAVAVSLLILPWWLFFSRAPWLERLGALALMAAGLFVTYQIIHVSIRGGMMGFMFPIFSIPIVLLALVAWAVAARRLSSGPRRTSMVVVLLLASGVWAVMRTGGLSGTGQLDLHWRWTATPEDLLLAQQGARPAGAVTGSAAEAGPAWPGFRGPDRDSLVRGVRIRTDWAASPPAEIWRRPVGPGWSSFAVQGDRIYTQEQRGEEEIVSCYSRTTGEPVWMHADRVRFYESNAGPGPRATPTLHEGRLYTLGATGVVNALEAGDGRVVWSRDAAADTGAKLPIWGFSGSPLVAGDQVVVATSGILASYDIATGEPRWKGPKGGVSYSSPHMLMLGGVPQIALMSMTGIVSVAPADGAVIWKHEWKNDGIVQPALTPDGDVLLGSGSGLSEVGMRRLAVKPAGAAAATVEERWTSMGLKPYFNDFVVHEGHAYGFDGAILSCIEVAGGERKWKGGRYGHGQLILLPDQDLLVVLSEQGDLALVSATPDGHTEHARHASAVKGKTWNHPVLAGDVLLVRNAEEMAAFRLPVEVTARVP